MAKKVRNRVHPHPVHVVAAPPPPAPSTNGLAVAEPVLTPDQRDGVVSDGQAHELEAWRSIAGLTVDQAARAVGVSTPTFYRWIAGSTAPSGHIRDRIEVILARSYRERVRRFGGRASR